MVERIYLLLEVLTVVFCLFALYGKKFRLDIYTVLMVALDVIFMEAITEKILSENLTGLIYPIIFLYCCMEFKCGFKLTIVNNCLYIIIVFVAQILCSIPFTIFVRGVSNVELQILAINIITFVILFIIIKLVKLKRISDFVVSKDWLSTILMILYLVLVMYSIQIYRIGNMFDTDYYVLMIGFIILTIAFTAKWQESKNKIMRQKLELEMYEVYNHTFEELLHNIRRKQHDYKNQLVAISSLQYTSKSYEELVSRQNEYLAYINHESELDCLLAINMPIIGGFLYSKFSIWKEQNIDISYQIKSDVRAFGVPVYEVITILGIILDNAYDAVREYPNNNKRIQFIMEDKEENVIFRVKNPNIYLSYEEIELLFKEGHSSKGENRGIGLCNAKERVLKYNMSLGGENEEQEGQNWICFSLYIKR